MGGTDDADVGTGKAATTEEPVLRHRLVDFGDSVFFSCQSVLYAMLGGPVLAAVVAGMLRPNHATYLGPALAIGSLVAFVVIAALRLRTTVFSYVDVGADGIVVRRRFIPYRAIEELTERVDMATGEHAVLRLGDGTSVEFRVNAIPPKARDVLLGRLRRKIRAYRVAEREGPALELLDRGERSLPMWREAVGRLLAKGDYRNAPIALADVRDTLENAAASVERRIGAAIALTGSDEPDAKERVRIAASACADLRLRVALAQIAEGTDDEEALREALAQAEASSPRASA